MNELEPIDIRTGLPFASRCQHLHHRIEGASIGVGGCARWLMGGAFMGVMLSQQKSGPTEDDYVHISDLARQWDAIELGDSVTNQLWTDIRHGVKAVSPWNFKNFDFSTPGAVYVTQHRYRYADDVAGGPFTIETFRRNVGLPAEDAYFQANASGSGFYMQLGGIRIPSSGYATIAEKNMNAENPLNASSGSAFVYDGAGNARFVYTESGKSHTEAIAIPSTYAPQIGLGATTAARSGPFYAVRIYRRALTDAELYQNWLMDAERFGFL